jgi:hypothetical protein
VVLGAIAALGFAAAPAQAASLVVDDNRVECPSAAFTSIQAAVDAAAAGDTIAVCAGTYVEGDGGTQALVITKSLAIRGTGADSVFIQPNGGPDNSIFGDPAGNAAGPPLRDAIGNIISVTGPGVNVDISGVTVRAANVAVETGIDYLNATGTIADVRVTDLVQTAATGGPGRFAIFQRGQGIVAFSTVATGTFPITITRSEISGYNKGGIVVDSLDAALVARSGSQVVATITNSIVQGAGRQPVGGIGQNGIQVSFGASATIRGNTISDNFFGPQADQAAGILMVDAVTAATTINLNNIQNNSFGLANVDAAGAPNPATAGIVNAENNWWGSQNGPAPVVNNAPDPNLGDPVTVDTVDFVPFSDTPFAIATAAGTPADAPPAVKITSPADGAVVQPDAAIPVAATATDDLAVDRVVFRVGTTVIGTDSTPPYAATFTPTAAQAGTSQVITATAIDTSGQSSVDAVSVQVASAATPAGPAAPAAPAAAEDRPPTVSFTAPRENALVQSGATTTVTATAADDRGVASVTFIKNGGVLCRDTSAPFTCDFRPSGDDVGRNTLTAIATDTSGQTAAAIRNVRVTRFRPRGMSATTTPGRDRTAPWTFRTRGRVALPAGVTAAQACGSGVVSVQIKRGANTVSTRRVLLTRSCGYSTSVRFDDRQRIGRSGRLRVTARFLGNARLTRATARTRIVRAG